MEGVVRGGAHVKKGDVPLQESRRVQQEPVAQPFQRSAVRRVEVAVPVPAGVHGRGIREHRHLQRHHVHAGVGLPAAHEGVGDAVGGGADFFRAALPPGSQVRPPEE